MPHFIDMIFDPQTYRITGFKSKDLLGLAIREITQISGLCVNPLGDERRLQQLIGGVMADRCIWHAKVAAGIGAALFAFALVLRFAAGL